MQLIKLFILFIFCFSCNKQNTIKNIYINKTQKVQIKNQWNSDYKISYLWSKPIGPNNSEWIIDNDVMLFTPRELGAYTIEVSIENNMGEVLGKEFFYYNVIPQKKYNNTKGSISLQTNDITLATTLDNNSKEPSYTLQISSWNNIHDAKKDKEKLIQLGFDAYLTEKIINNKTWYRIRVGKNLSHDKSKKIKKQLEKVSYKNIWISKY